jgi:hypothetical protein
MSQNKVLCLYAANPAAMEKMTVAAGKVTQMDRFKKSTGRNSVF